MASDLSAANEHAAEHAVVSQLSSFISCYTVGFINRIKFASDVLTDSVINKGEQRFRYKLVWCNNK